MDYNLCTTLDDHVNIQRFALPLHTIAFCDFINIEPFITHSYRVA